MPNPSPCDRSMYEFHKIPDGAVAEFWIEGPQNDFASVAEITCSDVAVSRQVIPDSTLHRPPGGSQKVQLRVQKPNLYALTLTTIWLSSNNTTAVLNLRFQAGVVDKQLKCTITGNATSGIDRRHIFLKTLQS